MNPSNVPNDPWEWSLLILGGIAISGLLSGMVAAFVTHRLKSTEEAELKKEQLYANLLTHIQMFPKRLDAVLITKSALYFPRLLVETRESLLGTLADFSSALNQLSLSDSRIVIESARRLAERTDALYAPGGLKYQVEGLATIVEEELPKIRDAMRKDLGRNLFPTP